MFCRLLRLFQAGRRCGQSRVENIGVKAVQVEMREGVGRCIEISGQYQFLFQAEVLGLQPEMHPRHRLGQKHLHLGVLQPTGQEVQTVLGQPEGQR